MKKFTKILLLISIILAAAPAANMAEVMPPVPELVSPANGSTNVSVTPTLVYNPVEGAASYNVQVSEFPNFMVLTVDAQVIASEYSVGEEILQNGHTYYWRVRAWEGNSYGAFSETWGFQTEELTGVHHTGSSVPSSIKLYQNYPNPFNPSTKIKFDVPSVVKGDISNVKLVVYNIVGGISAVLVDESLKAGSYEAEWNAKSSPSGVYFYRLIVGNAAVQVKKMMLVK